ncbi:serine/threonine-protein kinase [Mycolicibacterium fallax]|uniref:non-specific serine/threonine protein kinase n=1 Tax=Mycolicibacterium fallax TaxID=1793 RepID=A0A1X1REU2_MYCFA|nr:serine/threonine-protein kinase [Mycolicibacterium fallax]ORV04214.1 hypothetical protein AWC04_08635 [Mycolicibacterium fallax]BBY98383.1 hypothetical protein MFAL_18500 [Mycolicibacterium fallax]
MTAEAGMDEEFGRYRLRGTLGTGGMGQVYRAYDTALNREVALKVLHAGAASDPVFVARFKREALVAAGIDEPHVVPIYDSGEINGRLFIAMRLIAGTDVASMLKKGPLPPEQAVSLIEQAAAALDSAHDAGLEHRDIKPGNLLVTPKNFLYLIDFGIARAPGEAQLTNTDATIGTAAYIAPERLTRGVADHRADVYSLACVLFECLTGSKPYAGESLERQLYAHVHEPPPRPSEVNPAVPAAFDAVIARGMAVDPDQRFSSAPSLAAAARAALTEGGSAPVLSTAEMAMPDFTGELPTPTGPTGPGGPFGPNPTRQLETPGPGYPDTRILPADALPPAVLPPAVPPPAVPPPAVPPPAVVPAAVAPTPPPLPPELAEPAETPAPNRRRRWIVVLAAAAAAVMLVVAVAIGLPGGDDAAEPGPVVTPTQATVFSVGGEPDHPDRAGRAIDGNPDTGWTTDIYSDATPFPTFKAGVGLMLTLPSPTRVATVSVAVPSTGTAVEIRSAQTANPASLADTTVLAGPTTLTPGDNTITVGATEPTSHLLVWISTLGSTDGQSRTRLSEIVVHAAR